MQQTLEQLEFAISQYLDGNLPLLERQTLEARLAKDASARLLLEEYRALDGLVKNAITMPELAWDKVASCISENIELEEAPVANYRMTFGSIARVAVAACLMLTFGFFALKQMKKPTRSITVTGPVVGSVAGSPVTEISVGPSQAMLASQDAMHSSEVIISRPATVIIASFDNSAQDSDELPYGG